MFRHTHLIVGALFTCLMLTYSFRAIADPCVDAYDGNLADVTDSHRVSVANSTAYSQYCEANGSVNKSAVGVNVSAIVYSIPFTVGLSQSSDDEKMQNFCKTGFEQHGFYNKDDDYTRTVIVAAENNLNECLKFEHADLVITHKYAAPSLVTINGTFQPTIVEGQAPPAAYLTRLEYDTSRITCSSNSFKQAGATEDGPKTIDHNSGRLTITGSFTIECERTKSAITVSGKEEDRYEDVQVTASLLAPNVNESYVISLPAVENYGPALSTEYGQRLADLSASIANANAVATKASSDRDALQGRLDRAGIVKVLGFFIGGDEFKYDYNQHYNCGTNPDQVATDFCASNAPGTTPAVYRAGRARGATACSIGNHPGPEGQAYIAPVFFVATCMSKQ